ncbi:Ribosomal RNA small subunit methyltransferase B [bacterium HR32]|nr:Ribosomal RNA small subunit methyltransferase B [bacterium HR32]
MKSPQAAGRRGPRSRAAHGVFGPVRTGREAALWILVRVEGEGAFANVLLSRSLPRWGLPRGEAELASELALGVLRWRARLDWTLEHLLGRPVDRLPLPVRQALRLGAYQVLFLQRVSPAVAVSSSVELTKRVGHAGTAALVNAVLRRLVREGEAPPPEADDHALAVRTSHPLWLVRRWVQRWGLEEASRLCEANNLPPPAHVRVNTLRARPEEVVLALQQAGAQVEPGSLPESLHVHEGLEARLRLEAEGRISPQDEAAMVVARAVDPQPDELVVDACAAPGGKATHLAALMGDRGRVVACDVSPRKVEALRRRVERYGARCVEARVVDARNLDVRGADRVLVDAPCTGIGVVRRRPEIRWRVGPQDLVAAAAQQREILAGAARAARPGGVVVYSVCSTEPEEGEAVVEWLLATGEYAPEPFAVPWRGGQLWSAADGCLRLFPHRHGTDGYFVARLRRR